MVAPAPRKVSVSEVKARLLQPALTSHYEVYIKPPNTADGFIRQSGFRDNMQSLLILSCSEATLPGSQLATHDLNNDFTGVSQKHAYRKLYDDRVDFTFYVNENYDQIRYFEAWIRYISGEKVSGSEGTNNNYRIQYPKNYKSPSINITKFERNLGTKDRSNKIVYTFINAFPISIGSMPVSYDSSQLLKVTVSFAYDRYITGNVSVSTGGTGGPGGNTEPGQTNAIGVPRNPFDLTPDQQALFNREYSQNFNLSLNQFNISSGTAFNTLGEGEEIINAVTELQNPVESGLPYVGRNVGPLAPFR